VPWKVKVQLLAADRNEADQVKRVTSGGLSFH